MKTQTELALTLALAGIAAACALLTPTARADEPAKLSVVAGLATMHTSAGQYMPSFHEYRKYNNDNHLIGVQLSQGHWHAGLGTMTNSFYQRSYIASAGYDQPVNPYLSFGADLAVASGYSDLNIIHGDLAPMFAPYMSLHLGDVSLKFSSPFGQCAEVLFSYDAIKF